MTGTIFLKSPRRMSSCAALKKGVKSSMDSGSHSTRGAPPSPKRDANSSTLSSSHDAGWRQGWGSSRKKSAMKKAGRDGWRIGDCSNGPQPTKTRPGAVWMKAKSRDTIVVARSRGLAVSRLLRYTINARPRDPETPRPRDHQVDVRQHRHPLRPRQHRDVRRRAPLVAAAGGAAGGGAAGGRGARLRHGDGRSGHRLPPGGGGGGAGGGDGLHAG